MLNRGWILGLLLSALVCSVSAQDSTKAKERAQIRLVHADRFTVDETTPEGASKLKGDVQLQHDDATMYCDSAFLYDKDNSLDAFGNVRIVEGDSLDLTGDSLFYDGNTGVARIRGKVRVDNGASVLTTRFLDYDRGSEVGYYYGGGEIDSNNWQS